MNASRRLGLVLLIVLATWFVIYWWQCAPVADSGFSADGLILNSDDTVGTNPDQGGGDGKTEPADGQAPSDDDDGAGSTVTGEATGPEDSDFRLPDDIVLPPPPPTTPYTVQAGDTMDSIALWWFGDARKWVLISQENPLVDPMHLRTGQQLRLPAQDAALESMPREILDDLLRETRYVVVQGDTLSGIARQFYGDPNLWRIIYDANRAVIPNPDRLKVGTELVLPRRQIPADGP